MSFHLFPCLCLSEGDEVWIGKSVKEKRALLLSEVKGGILCRARCVLGWDALSISLGHPSG